MATLGIDISSWQSKVDYEQLKDAVQYVIIRTGYGSPSEEQVDNMFSAHLRGCQSNDILTGAYHYGYAISEEEARTEANFCLSILNGATMIYPVFYDIEESSMYNLGRDKLTSVARAFCEVIESAGYKAGIYCNLHCANNYIDLESLPYDKWIAQYANQCSYSGNYQLWQFTNNGSIAGISGSVDLNYCYKDYTGTSAEYTWIWDSSEGKWRLKQDGSFVYDEWIWDSNYHAWYRIDKEGYMVSDSWWQDPDGNWYYLSQDGKMLTGWLWDGQENAWYYLNSSGQMLRSFWVSESNGDLYFLRESGKMASNENLTFDFDDSGKWINKGLL